MIKFNLCNKETVKRALLVAVLAAAASSFCSTLMRDFLDTVYRVTQSDFSYGLFYALSTLQRGMGQLLWFVLVAFSANWVLYPAFASFSALVGENLRTPNAPPPKLPKQFAKLEQELAAMQKELQLWKYAQEEAEKRKDELVAYLAHDIRTPLTSVLGYLELICENPDLPPEKSAHFAETALRKARRMETLVEELFEITRFNIGQMELHKQPVHAGVLLRQLAEEINPLLENRGQTVTVQGGEQVNLFADPQKLARALDNILHNAAAYAPPGTNITLACEGGEKETTIKISNTGNEISAAELERFFEKFYRGAARQSETGGAGLGLAIARSIVQAHGGTLTAANSGGVTTFTATLPAGPGQ